MDNKLTIFRENTLSVLGTVSRFVADPSSVPAVQSIRELFVNMQYARLVRQLAVQEADCRVSGIDPLPDEVWAALEAPRDVKAFLHLPVAAPLWEQGLSLRTRLDKPPDVWVREALAEKIDFQEWFAVSGRHLVNEKRLTVGTVLQSTDAIDSNLAPNPRLEDLYGIEYVNRIGGGRVNYSIWGTASGDLYRVTRTTIKRVNLTVGAKLITADFAEAHSPIEVHSVACLVTGAVFSGGAIERDSLEDEIRQWIRFVNTGRLTTRMRDRKSYPEKQTDWEDFIPFRDEPVTLGEHTDDRAVPIRFSSGKDAIEAAYERIRAARKFRNRRSNLSLPAIMMAGLMRKVNPGLGPAELAAGERGPFVRVSRGRRVSGYASGGDAYAVLAADRCEAPVAVPKFFMDEDNETWLLLANLPQFLVSLGAQRDQRILSVLLKEFEEERPTGPSFTTDFMRRLLEHAPDKINLDHIVQSCVVDMTDDIQCATARVSVAAIKAAGYACHHDSADTACFYAALPEYDIVPGKLVELKYGVPLSGLSAGRVGDNAKLLYYAGRTVLVCDSGCGPNGAGLDVPVVHLEQTATRFPASGEPEWQPLQGCYAKHSAKHANLPNTSRVFLERHAQLRCTG